MADMGALDRGDNRPMRYIETVDGIETVVYRASSLAACERAMLATAKGLPGMPHPAWFQEVLDEGTMCEGDIADMWEQETGVPTVGDQLEVELEIGEIDSRRIVVRGHIDGEAARENPAHAAVGREYKKFRESTWENFKRQGVEVNKNYPWQVSVYWHALDWVAVEFVGGHIVGYTCGARANQLAVHAKRDDECDEGCDPDTRMPVIGEVFCHHMEAAPIPLKDIIKRVVKLERLVNSGLDAMEVACPEQKMYPCPYYTLHDPTDDEYTLPKNKRTAEVVQTFVNVDTRLSDLRAQVKELESAKKTLAGELREIVGAQGREADNAKKIVYPGPNGDITITRTKSHYPEKLRAAYDVDSFTLQKPRKAAAKKAAAKKAPAAKKTTRVRKASK